MMKKSFNELAAHKFFAANPSLNEDLTHLAAQYEEGGDYHCRMVDVYYDDSTHMLYRIDANNPFVRVKKDNQEIQSKFFVSIRDAMLDSLLDNTKIMAINAIEYAYTPYVSEVFGELPMNLRAQEREMLFVTNKVKLYED